MENVRPINHLDIIKRDWRKVLIVTLIVVLIALVFSLVQSFLYRSTVSILVLQKSSFSIDAYSASKSEERIANKLAQVVYSSSFLKEVLNSGFYIDKEYFPTDELKKRNKWSKTVEAEVPAGLSKLTFSIYHTDPNQALQISQAIAYTLTTEKREYIGIEDVDLKVLDTPLVSKYPVRPNILVNMILGVLFGLVLGLAYVVLTYNPDRDKLLTMSPRKDYTPHLIDNDDVPADDSVEEDMSELKEVPEIDDLDEVVEMEEVEELQDKPVESEKPFPQEQMQVPDISGEITGNDADLSVETEEVDSNDIEVKEVEESGGKDYPSFEDDDKIVSMK